ncbi:undecaprenyl-phosphate galactose phosphotransferase [Leptolyngbya sp. Heron Island J]|uniref:heterocyst development glycosyltransferase HepC n=1 Tax=Leptolyngbya sp. Heron Island J TaxID=1385935 RepID=UPI0003B9BAFA|nr:heterocyst development glycosyltransferase HepC [Leptolyngbya sp. Heron Island J]ESA38665.1 undecaprenyl-phosphate galactose phosphotransferase [Leptolyngbya sp. Heron Island J]
MTASTVLLKAPILFQVPSAQRELSPFENCTLIWEQDALIVKSRSSKMEPEMPALQNKKWLSDCLRHSPVKRVYLDPKLAPSKFKAWADICSASNKQVYLSVPAAPDLPQLRQPKLWRVKRLADWMAACILLTVLSPLMALLALWVRLDSRGPILFRQWRVGYQGRLFQICKFRSMETDAEFQHHRVMGNQTGLHKLEQDPRVTRAGRWLRKFSLDELPQLLNVLRGEMTLVGPRPWALYDAVRIEPVLRRRLSALPGITGMWQVTTRSQGCDLTSVNRMDLDYLRQWTFREDLKLLLLTLPKVVTGFGAY